MSELRAPDPTLTALDVSVEVTTGERPVAHSRGSTDEHMRFYGHVSLHARHARWFAVPCHECFPDAPPVGHRLDLEEQPDGTKAGHARRDPHLAWHRSDR